MKTPLKGSSFNLDVGGIAGFFGGEESFAAMSSVHLVRGRRWLGWYNSPGSYYVAKKYGVLARSRIWDGLYPGVNVDPTTMLELDGKSGPRYIAAHSGTRLQSTGHLTYLLSNYCDDLPVISDSPMSKLPFVLTLVELDRFEDHLFHKVPLGFFEGTFHIFIAMIPIGISIGACIVCGVFQEWFSFSLILVGILCNGISCLVIGAGEMDFALPDDPSLHSPPGDGILQGSGLRFILVKGKEKNVRRLTKGKFYLRYKSEGSYHDIGYASLGLTLQFIVQLFLIPQSQLFGQIMFLCTLGVSWIYNSYLASIDREDLQKHLLMGQLFRSGSPKEITFPVMTFRKWTGLVTFSIFFLKAQEARGFLNDLIPNDTQAWRVIKDTIVKAVELGQNPEELLEHGVKSNLNDREAKLVEDMLKEAGLGYREAKRMEKDWEASGTISTSTV